MPAGCADPELYEKTFMFAFFIYSIIFNSLNTRSEKFNLFEHIGENKRFVLVMGAIFVMQTVLIQIQYNSTDTESTACLHGTGCTDHPSGYGTKSNREIR